MYLNDGFDGRTRTGDSLAEKKTNSFVSLFNVMSLVLNEFPCSFKTFKLVLLTTAMLCCCACCHENLTCVF